MPNRAIVFEKAGRVLALSLSASPFFDGTLCLKRKFAPATRQGVMSGAGCRDGRSRKMLRAISLLLCVFLPVGGVSAANTPITATSPEGTSITDAAQLLDDFGAKQAANEIRAKLAAGGYSYGDVDGNAETDFARSNTRSTTKIATGFVHPSIPSERPIKSFSLKLRLAFLLFHENVHANQGYFNYRKNSFEPPAWMATIKMAEAWVTYAMGGVPTNIWQGNDPTAGGRVLTPKETLTLIRELRDYIREFREGEGHDPYYGLDPASADVTGLNTWESSLNSWEKTYQAIVDGTAPAAGAAAGNPAPGNAGTPGSAGGTTQPSVPADTPNPTPGNPANNMPGASTTTPPPATPAMGGTTPPSANQPAPGGTPIPSNPPPLGGTAQSNPGGNVLGGGAFTPVGGAPQQPCTSKAECDRLRAAADQAEKDAAAAKAAVTQAESNQQKAIQDAYRMDTEAENQAIRPSDVEMSAAEKLAAAAAKHKQAQALRDNAAAALKKAQDDAAAKAKAAADARAAADACHPCPEDNKTAQKTGTDTTPGTPPDKGTGTTGGATEPPPTNAVGGTPQTGSQVGGGAGAKKDEFAGGKEKRINFGKFGYEITRTTADGRITEQTLYTADGKFLSSHREEGSEFSLQTITYRQADGAYTIEVIDHGFFGGAPYRSTTSEYDQNGKLLTRTSFTNTFSETTGFTEVTETFGSDGIIVTTTRTWTGKKLRGDKPDSETTTRSSTPGLDQLGKEVQKAFDEAEKKAESDNKGFVPNPPKDEGQPKAADGKIGGLPGGIVPNSVPVGSIAFGNVTGNGTPQVIVGAAPGNMPQVWVIDGTTGQPLSSFFAYSPTFTGGVNVAVGDVNGDGEADIITGAGSGGGPHVKVFSGTGQELNSFFAYDSSFRGGVTVAVGDLNGDGKADIITGPGPGSGPQVKIFNGTGQPLNSFFAYGPSFTGGVNVGVGNFGNGMQVITSTGSPTRPDLRTFDSAGKQASLDDNALDEYMFAFGDWGRIANDQYAGSSFHWSLLPKERFDRLPDLGILTGGTTLRPNSVVPLWLQTQPTLSSRLDSAMQRTIMDFPSPPLPPPPPPPGALQKGPGSTVADSRSASHMELAAFHPTSAGKPRQQAPTITPSSSAPQPSAAANPGEIEFAIVSNGKTGDEAFQLQVYDPAGEIKEMPHLGGVVLEAVRRDSKDKPVAERHAGAAGLLTQQASALCLEFLKLPPEAGTLYRIAPQAVQEKFKPLRSILQAGHSLADKGQLHPDSDPKDYATFIRQFALWTKIENWDAKKFTDTFLERSKKNAELMNVKWSKGMEDALRSLAPGRWQDITAVLHEAETISKAGATKPAD